MKSIGKQSAGIGLLCLKQQMKTSNIYQITVILLRLDDLSVDFIYLLIFVIFDRLHLI